MILFIYTHTEGNKTRTTYPDGSVQGATYHQGQLRRITTPEKAPFRPPPSFDFLVFP